MSAPVRRRATLAVLVACAVCVLVPGPAIALDRAGYLAIADRLQVRLGTYFDEALARYDPGPGGTTTQVNADLLLVHAVAALEGHEGAARDDRRARLVARFLVGPDAWTEPPLPPETDRGLHGPAWRAAPDHFDVHMVFVTEAAEGLAMAHRARAELGLDADTVARIRDELARVAASRDWRWPALRLNQFNWYAAVFAADAGVNGTAAALASGMRRHLDAFLAAAGRPGAEAGQPRPGLALQLPARASRRAPANFDSAEYANIVLGFSRYYGQARRAGMPQPVQRRLLVDWVRRTLAGYWTHAGYLNWDTGLGFAAGTCARRCRSRRRRCSGSPPSRSCSPAPEWGTGPSGCSIAVSSSMPSEPTASGAFPAALAYGVNVVPQTRATRSSPRRVSRPTRCARSTPASASRRRPSRLRSTRSIPTPAGSRSPRPPTTPRSSPINRRAFPYGGLDIARLFDGRQEVAASIGGRSPAAFGLRVRGGGRVRLRTQYGAPRPRAPLRLTRAPQGVGASPSARRAYAGAFSELRVRGAVARRAAGGRRRPTASRRARSRRAGRSPAGAATPRA